jgi:serine/threonine-protein kinase HipA
MMTLARVAGVDVAETRVVSFGKREALLVRRFDRIPQADGSQTRLPFVSALSLLGLSETDLGGSYPEIADAMRKAGCPAEDLRQLFRRMVVNVACGNTDDHLKNHGFRLLDGRWRLTPAYDIVPSPDGMDIQAIGVGVLGSTPCYSNVLSKAGRFGVPHEEAVAIVQEVVAVMSTWREHFEQCRVPTVDIKRLERCIGRMQERHMATARVPAP